MALRGIKAILLDLDDTLLINPMSRFVPAYMQLICQFSADLVSPEKLSSSLLRGTRAMEKNTDPSTTNETVFFSEFFSSVGVEERVLRPRLERFYVDSYPELESLTHPSPFGRTMVERSFQAGLQVVIATNPLFPRMALEQRIAWADVPLSEFPYSLVTAFDNMHAAKPNPEYYFEILDNIGRNPQDCLMVGDDWDRDIAPAASIGIRVFWIRNQKNETPDNIPPYLWLGQGSLADLIRLLFP